MNFIFCINTKNKNINEYGIRNRTKLEQISIRWSKNLNVRDDLIIIKKSGYLISSDEKIFRKKSKNSIILKNIISFDYYKGKL